MSEAPVVLLNQAFSDMSMLGDAIDWDLDFRQIEAGKLDAHAMLMAGSRNLIMRVEFNRKFHQRGCPPPDSLTFGLPDLNVVPLRWHSKTTQAGALLNFNNGQLDGVNQGSLGGYTLSFPKTELEWVAEVIGIDFDLALSLQQNAFWNPQDAEHDILRSNLRLLEVVGSSANSSEHRLKETGEVLDFDLAASVVRILGREQMKSHRETLSFRAAARKRALKLIDDAEQIPSSVAELCRSAGASLATLERAFTEEFGVSPKSYMQAKRLTTVRHELLRSDPEVLIADVANRSDFWHMGRFAAEYRKQFGELPSKTSRGHRS